MYKPPPLLQKFTPSAPTEKCPLLTSFFQLPMKFFSSPAFHLDRRKISTNADADTAPSFFALCSRASLTLPHYSPPSPPGACCGPSWPLSPSNSKANSKTLWNTPRTPRIPTIPTTSTAKIPQHPTARSATVSIAYTPLNSAGHPDRVTRLLLPYFFTALPWAVSSHSQAHLMASPSSTTPLTAPKSNRALILSAQNT